MYHKKKCFITSAYLWDYRLVCNKGKVVKHLFIYAVIYKLFLEKSWEVKSKYIKMIEHSALWYI